MEAVRKIRIMVVDDDPSITLGVEFVLSDEFDAEVEIAEDCASAREKFVPGRYNLITLDYRLPDGTGLDLLKEMKMADARVSIIMMSGTGDRELPEQALSMGATNYVIKDTPELSANLCEVVRAALTAAIPAEADQEKGFQVRDSF